MKYLWKKYYFFVVNKKYYEYLAKRKFLQKFSSLVGLSKLERW